LDHRVASKEKRASPSSSCSPWFKTSDLQEEQPAPPRHHDHVALIDDMLNNAGRNIISAMHKGCALFQNRAGSGGFTGSSLNVYDADRRKPHQTQVSVGNIHRPRRRLEMSFDGY
jgi:hypothetical protein